MATEIKVPTLGESVTTATIARWLKHEGDTVAADDPLVELETDKVTVEVNAPAAGVLSSISAQEGDEVEVGSLLAMLDAGASASPGGARTSPAPPRQAANPAPTPAASPSPAPQAAAAEAAAAPAVAAAPASHAAANPAAGVKPPPRPLGPVSRPAMAPPSGTVHAPLPAATRLIEEQRIAASDIGEGSGKDGRITKGDVLAFLNRPVTPRAPDAREQRVKMTRLRRTIAARLKEAQNNAAMLTTFNEVDMSAVM